MLRVVENNHTASAKRYYTGGLAQGDYFVNDLEQAGIWGGKGAERLGLTGEVDRQSFMRLCENRMPDGTGQLTERTRAKRRVGYDINFHCPKSVSVVEAITGDGALRAAFIEAVQDTMRLIESEAKTRVRLGGVSEDRTTGNLVWGTFVHTTSRPIDGVPDPHLHAHAFTFNATFDETEGRWKAAQFGDIKRNAPYFEACFHASLASRVAKAGYGIEHRGKFWEIAGVPDRVLQEFSKRTAEIDQTAKDRGITDAKAKDELGARTRRRKSEAKSRELIEEIWKGRISPAESEALVGLKQSRDMTREISAREAVEHSLTQALVHSSVAEERRVIEGAIRYGLGSVSQADIRGEFERLNVVRADDNGRVIVTTKSVLKDEERMVAFAREGRGTCQPMNPTFSGVDLATLTESQQNSVERVLLSPDRVIAFRPGVRGAAAIELAIQGIESGGARVTVLDGGSRVARTKDSIQGVEGFLRDESAKETARGSVLWIKHAERLGVSGVRNLFDVADGIGARVILCGQSFRKGPPDQRGALALLEAQGGVWSPSAEHRHGRTREARDAVDAAKNGKIREAVGRLDGLGDIRGVSQDKLADAVAKEYAKAIRDGKSARIAASHETERMTKAVRGELRAQRLLGKPRKIDKLTRVGLSEEQRSDASFYEKGQVVVFYKAAKGFKAGHRYEVVGRDPFGNVLAREIAWDRPLPVSKKLWVEALPLSKSGRFDVFELGSIELSKGDVVRITATGRTLNERFGLEKLLSKRQQAVRLANLKVFGMKVPDRRYKVRRDGVHRIAGFTSKGDIKLENGWVLSKRYGHLDYGYCCSGATPGNGTFDRLIWAERHQKFGDFGNAAMPTAKESVVVFTNDKKALLGVAEPSESSRPAALRTFGTGPGGRNRDGRSDREEFGRER